MQNNRNKFNGKKLLRIVSFSRYNLTELKNIDEIVNDKKLILQYLANKLGTHIITERRAMWTRRASPVGYIPRPERSRSLKSLSDFSSRERMGTFSATVCPTERLSHSGLSSIGRSQVPRSASSGTAKLADRYLRSIRGLADQKNCLTVLLSWPPTFNRYRIKNTHRTFIVGVYSLAFLQKLINKYLMIHK